LYILKTWLKIPGLKNTIFFRGIITHPILFIVKIGLFLTMLQSIFSLWKSLITARGNHILFLRNIFQIPGNIVTSMKYDGAGNQSRLVDPSAGTMQYTYNAFGQLVSQVNGRGQQTTLTYDNLGMLTGKTTPEGTTSYSYNTNKQLSTISAPGNVSTAYTYDSKGRISGITEGIDGTNFPLPLLMIQKAG